MRALRIHSSSEEGDTEPMRSARRRRISFDESDAHVVSKAAGQMVSQEIRARAGGVPLEESVRKESDASVQSFGDGPLRKWSESSEGRGRARANTMHDVESLGARRRRVCFDEADMVGHEREPEIIGRRPRCHTMHHFDPCARERQLRSDENDDLESLVSGSAGPRSVSECMDLEADEEEAGLLNSLAEMVVEDDYEMTTIPASEDMAASTRAGADVATFLASAPCPRGSIPCENDGALSKDPDNIASIRLSRRPRVASPWANHQDIGKDSDAIFANLAMQDDDTTVPPSRRPRAGSPWKNMDEIIEGIDETDSSQRGNIAEEVDGQVSEQHQALVRLSGDGALIASDGPGPLVVLVALVPLLPIVMLMLMFLFVLLDSWPSSNISKWWIQSRQPQGRRKPSGYLTSSY